ncbi:MAG: hypothetical protein HC859_05710 [Bacteroidia bacterium]|nr:hypothetical protein [Bacteroidia bacterium]
MVTPADHAENVDVARNITSNIIPGATQYTIQLSQYPDFAFIEFELTGPSITLPVSGLKFNKTYYNRVLTDKAVTYGPVRSFTTRTAESQTYVTFPADHATGIGTKLYVISKEVPYATQYTIQLSRQPDFSDIDFERTGATRILAFSGLTQGTIYYNRVRTNISPQFGPVRSFVTRLPSSAPIAFNGEAENQSGEFEDSRSRHTLTRSRRC